MTLLHEKLLSPSVLNPHNLELEQELLAVILNTNETLETIGEIVLAEHFYHPVHAKLYENMVRLVHKGLLATPITVYQNLQEDAALQELGGKAYVGYLAGILVFPQQSLSYATLLRELFMRRRLIILGQTTIENAQKNEEALPAQEQIEVAEKTLFDLSESGSEGMRMQPFSLALNRSLEMAQAAYKRDSHVVGVTTGLVDMDKLLGGMHPSDLIVLAGRPSMGKSALAMNMAFNAAKASARNKSDGATVAVFSLEMSSEQLATRILGQETQVSPDRIRRGAVSKDDFPKFIRASQEMSDLPLFVDDTPALSLITLRNRARRLQRRSGLGMIVIDYLQLLTTGRRNNENRVQEISEITRGLKALAKELNVPVLALSQLSRAVENRDDKRPQLADLRESGTIEQDADVVMFIYREEYYHSRKKPPEGSEKMAAWQHNMDAIANIAEVQVAKQRHGPIGTVRLHYEPMFTTFGNLAC